MIEPLPFYPRDFFDGGKISLRHFEKPRVSIIIPVYNQLTYTLNCIYSLVQSIEEISYEIILVDDCSTDETAEALSQATNLYYLRNETNQGFLRNINRGLQTSRGEYVLLMNNDILVYPRFLEAMVQTFERDKTVGAVGGMVLYPNLLIHEAGGYFNRHGKATMWGRGESPTDPEFNFVKVVDYCSGCCLLIRRLMPDGELAQLDSVYAPAYYEDSDFCLRLKAHFGLNTVFQPEAKLIHFESVSYSEKRKNLIAVNEQTFLARWHIDFIDWSFERARYFRDALVIMDAEGATFDELFFGQIARIVPHARVFFYDKYAEPLLIKKMQQMGVQVINQRDARSLDYLRTGLELSERILMHVVGKRRKLIRSAWFFKTKFFSKKFRYIRSLNKFGADFKHKTPHIPPKAIRHTKKRLASLGELDYISDGGIYNPGMLSTETGYFGLFRVEANYDAYEGKKFDLPCLPVYFEFNSKLEKTRHIILQPPKYKKQTRVEDFRILRYRDQVLVAHPGMRIDKQRRGFRQYLSVLNLQNQSVDSFRSFESFSKREEKNWGWFTRGDELYMIYSISPWIIYQYDIINDRFTQVIAEEKNRAWPTQNFRSVSSLPIEYEGNYLLFVHGVTADRNYTQSAVIFDKFTLQPLYHTPSPIFQGGMEDGRHRRVFYVTSVVAEENRLLVFYGEGDSHTSVAIIDRNEFNNIIYNHRI